MNFVLNVSPSEEMGHPTKQMGDNGSNCGSVNMKGTINVVPLALMTRIMGHRINSVVIY